MIFQMLWKLSKTTQKDETEDLGGKNPKSKIQNGSGVVEL